MGCEWAWNLVREAGSPSVFSFFSTNQIALGVNGRVMNIAVKKIFFSYRREEDFLFLSCLYVAAAGMGRFPWVQIENVMTGRPGPACGWRRVYDQTPGD